jgi:lysophospholipase L1-like esterase
MTGPGRQDGGRGSHRRRPARPPAPIKVMPLGDSITYGVGSQTLNSYRIDLQNRLKAAGMTVDFVGSQKHGSPSTADLDHEGHSGWTIAGIAAQVDGWLATYQPDAVLLHIGTNDLRTDAGTVGATARLSSLINQITAARPGAEVFVAKIIGNRSHIAQQERTDAYNAAIPGIVAATGSKVHLVDQSTVRDLDIRDNHHPNDFGFAKMSWNWYQAMQKVYNATGTPWPAANNPYLAQKAYRCLLFDADPGPKYVRATDCRWWYRHLVTRTANGKPAKVYQWETQRVVTETYKVWIAGHYEYKVVKGKKTKVWIAGHDETRTRKVTKWVTA